MATNFITELQRPFDVHATSLNERAEVGQGKGFLDDVEPGNRAIGMHAGDGQTGSVNGDRGAKRQVLRQFVEVDIQAAQIGLALDLDDFA